MGPFRRAKARILTEFGKIGLAPWVRAFPPGQVEGRKPGGNRGRPSRYGGGPKKGGPGALPGKIGSSAEFPGDSLGTKVWGEQGWA